MKDTDTPKTSNEFTSKKDLITKKIPGLVKNLEKLDLSKLKSCRRTLSKLKNNKIVASSKTISNLLVSSIETIDEQILSKEQIQCEKKDYQEKNEKHYGKIIGKEHGKNKNMKAKWPAIDKKTIIGVALAIAFFVLLICNFPNLPKDSEINGAEWESTDNNLQSGSSETNDPTDETETIPLNTVNIKIECDENLIFSTYNLKILLDDGQENYLNHGGTEVFQFKLKDGTYTLTIANSEDSNVQGSVTFSIADDTDIEYNIHCYFNEVDITQKHFEIMRPLLENETKVPNDYNYYLKKMYVTVADSLRAVGFSNIRTVEIRDLPRDENNNVGKVKSISINGRTDFNAGEIFNKNDEIIITYHSLEPSAEEMRAKITNKKDAPAAEIIASFEGTGYKLVCYVQEKEITNFNPEGYLFVDGTINTITKTANLNFTTQELIDAANKLELYIPQSIAKRVAVVAMTNSQATDVFKSDGFTYNTSKFHKYSDISGFYLSVTDYGDWKVKDEHTWRVTNMKCMMSGYYNYLKASMEITYDGKNYIVSNVEKVIADKKYIDSNDPNKVNIEHLEPSKSNPFLTVSPSLIREDRNASAEKKQNNKTMPTAERTAWIDDQFTFWAHRHKKLEEMIKDRLHNEKSYDHISTTHEDLIHPDLVKMWNKTLAAAGYSQRVKIGDLIVICRFSAKNAFNATIKSTAYAVVRFDKDTIELIGIE